MATMKEINEFENRLSRVPPKHQPHNQQTDWYSKEKTWENTY